jgi:hypothetical protein
MYWGIARYGILVVIGCLIGWTINGWRLNANIASLRASYAEEMGRVVLEARNREKSLVEASERIKRSRDAQIKDINRSLNAAVAELRLRPSRNDPRPPDTPACSGATGAELSKEDAEFLAIEAARADTVVEQLNYCIAQYNSIRK